MFNIYDQKNISNANQTVNLLTQDLRKLTESDNPLLAYIALETLQKTVKIEQQLNHIHSIANEIDIDL